MRRIWKFPLSYQPEQTVPITKGWTPLHVAIQEETPMLWAEVDPQGETAWATVYVVPTGYTEVPKAQHIGTVHHAGLVWHIYVKPEE